MDEIKVVELLLVVFLLAGCWVIFSVYSMIDDLKESILLEKSTAKTRVKSLFGSLKVVEKSVTDLWQHVYELEQKGRGKLWSDLKARLLK